MPLGHFRYPYARYKTHTMQKLPGSSLVDNMQVQQLPSPCPSNSSLCAFSTLPLSRQSVDDIVLWNIYFTAEQDCLYTF